MVGVGRYIEGVYDSTGFLVSHDETNMHRKVIEALEK